MRRRVLKALWLASVDIFALIAAMPEYPWERADG